MGSQQGKGSLGNGNGMPNGPKESENMLFQLTPIVVKLQRWVMGDGTDEASHICLAKEFEL